MFLGSSAPSETNESADQQLRKFARRSITRRFAMMNRLKNVMKSPRSIVLMPQRGNAIQSMLMIVVLNIGLYAMMFLKLYRSLFRIRFVKMYLSKIV